MSFTDLKTKEKKKEVLRVLRNANGNELSYPKIVVAVCENTGDNSEDSQVESGIRSVAKTFYAKAKNGVAQPLDVFAGFNLPELSAKRGRKKQTDEDKRGEVEDLLLELEGEDEADADAADADAADADAADADA